MKQEIVLLDSIVLDPDQPRLSIELDELKPFAMNIRDIGLLQPIIVYQDGTKFFLVDGHRRVGAHRLLGRSKIEALILEKKPSPDELLITQLAANCFRVDLKPTEKALAYKRLKDSRGWTNVELAKAMHTSKSTVTQVLSYLSLPDEVQKKLDSGELAGSTAYAISRAPDEASAQELIKKAVSGTLRRSDAVQNVAKKKSKVRSTFRLETCDVVIVASERFDLPATVAVLQQLARDCNKAAKNDHDTVTFERALSMKRRANS